MTTGLRFCLTLLLTLVVLGAASGQGGKQKTPSVPDLRELIADADTRAILDDTKAEWNQ